MKERSLALSICPFTVPNERNKNEHPAPLRTQRPSFPLSSRLGLPLPPSPPHSCTLIFFCPELQLLVACDVRHPRVIVELGRAGGPAPQPHTRDEGLRGLPPWDAAIDLLLLDHAAAAEEHLPPSASSPSGSDLSAAGMECVKIPCGTQRWERMLVGSRSLIPLGGVKSCRFNITGTSQGDFHIKMQLFDTKLLLSWAIIFVYGAAQEENKQVFLSELAAVCSDQTIPILLGGDFNLLRSSDEKNMNYQNNRNNDNFNYIINTYDLREIDLSGGGFTWSNNQENPTLEKLDRLLMSNEWEYLFPLANV